MKNFIAAIGNRLRIGQFINILIVVFSILQSNAIAQNPNEGKILLAVFAHPDDETLVSTILAKYVSEGVKVFLVIATDGRLGTNDFSGLEAGEGMAAVRREEMKCAAGILGVTLLHLKYYDQLKAAEGYFGHTPHVRALIKELYGIVEKIQPDVIITFGPDGHTNHMDHRLIGATVTQIFVNKVWNKPSALYYFGTPSDYIDDPESRLLRGVDKRYLTTRVSFTQEHLDIAYNSYKCHKSQFSPETIKSMKDRKSKNGMAVYFRKFVGPTEISDNIFE